MAWVVYRDPTTGGGAWAVASAVTILAGLVVRVTTVGRVPADTSGRTTVAPRAGALNTTGWYSVVRHPLYLGNYLMGLGVALYVGQPWLAIAFSMAFACFYGPIIAAEDAFLASRFAKAHHAWARSTPAIVPRLGGRRPAELPFSARAALRREYHGAYAAIAALFTLDVVRGWAVTGAPTAPAYAWWLFAVATTIWLGVRLLALRTDVLTEPGR